MRILRTLAWAFAIFFGIIILFIFSAIAPIDDTPIAELDEIQNTEKRFQQIELDHSVGDSLLQMGWSSINITPKNPIHMAGYGRRGPYHHVLDSLFSRCVVVDNGKKQVVFISLDLLMFPQEVMYLIEASLSKQGFSKDEIYLSATHTHNGFGNWEQSIAGELIFGNYDEKNVDFLVNQITKGVSEAIADKSPGRIGFSKLDMNELVVNRVAPVNGNKDPFLRLIHFQKVNGLKGILSSFSGHAVNLDADIWELSRDYPGILIDLLEKSNDVDFAMFCAGMVGSHNIKLDVDKGPQRIQKIGSLLSKQILNQLDSVALSSNTNIASADIPVDLPASQLRLTDNLRLRDWLFTSMLKPLNANIKVIELGNILFAGMPCDYSGELAINNQLDQLAASKEKQLMITSFNGNYIGYITEDAHYYSCQHDEVMSLNWVGPNKGAYFTDLLKIIIQK